MCVLSHCSLAVGPGTGQLRTWQVWVCPGLLWAPRRGHPPPHGCPPWSGAQTAAEVRTVSSPLPHPLAVGGSCLRRSLRSRVWTGRPVPVPGEGVLGGLPSGLCPGVSLAVFSGVASARGDLGPPEGLGVAWHVSSVFLPEPSPCSGEGWGETGSRGGDQVTVACRLPDSPLSLCRRGLPGQLCGQRDGALGLIPWEPGAPAL